MVSGDSERKETKPRRVLQMMSYNYGNSRKGCLILSRDSQIVSYNIVETHKGCSITPDIHNVSHNPAKIYQR